MDTKEQIYNWNEGIGAEPEELPEKLQSALRAAYPEPGGRIAAAVMNRIREERAAEEALRRAEKAEARRRRQGLVMKWGGMAACMMILCGALVLAAPLMNRSEAEMVMQDAAVMDMQAASETVPETAAYAGGVLTDQAPAEAEAYAYSAEDLPAENGAAEAEGQAEGQAEVSEVVAMTKTAPVKQNAEAAEAEEEPAMLFAVQSTAMGDAAAEDDWFDGSNESLLQLLLAEGALTEADYLAWMDGKGYTSSADWTAEELCEAFGLDASLWMESAAE